jgi:hypothetical protein
VYSCRPVLMSYDFVFFFSPNRDSDAVVDFRSLYLREYLCDLASVFVVDNG